MSIYIKSVIQVKVLNSLSKEKCFQLLALKVCTGNNNSFVVAEIYRPPSAPSHAIDDLVELLNPHINSEMLILGDFNLNWLTNVSDHLKEVCGNLLLKQLITEPTRPT